MYGQIFTDWGTLTMDGLALVQNLTIIGCTAAIVGSILYVNRKR